MQLRVGINDGVFKNTATPIQTWEPGANSICFKEEQSDVSGNEDDGLMFPNGGKAMNEWLQNFYKAQNDEESQSAMIHNNLFLKDD